MKGFIEVTDIMGNILLINTSEIQILFIDSNLKIKGYEKEIELSETYEEIKELIKKAQ